MTTVIGCGSMPTTRARSVGILAQKLGSRRAGKTVSAASDMRS